MFLKVLALALIAQYAHASTGANVRITRFGYNYGVQVGVKILEEQCRNLKVAGDSSGSTNLGVSDLKYSATDLKLNYVKASGVSVYPNGGSQIVVRIAKLVGSVGGKVGVRNEMKGVSTCIPYPCGWGKWCKKCHTIRPPGSFSISAGIGGSVEVSVWSSFSFGTSNGKPTVKYDRINIYFKGVSIKLTRSFLDKAMSWVINSVASLFKGHINGAISGVVKSMVNKYKSKLSKVPIEYSINSKIKLDYSLQRISGGAWHYTDIAVKGAFKHADGRLPKGVAPVSFDVKNKGNEMVSIWLSDFSFNSLMGVLLETGLLNSALDAAAAKIPSQYLTTKSFEKDLPDFLKKVGEVKLGIKLTASKAPYFHFSQDKASTTVYVNAQFSVNGANAFALNNLAVSCQGKYTVSSDGRKLTGLVYGAKLGGSLVTPFGKVGLENAVLNQVMMVALGVVNQSLQKGIPLPEIPDVALSNTAVSYVHNAMRISSDIRYKF